MVSIIHLNLHSLIDMATVVDRLIDLTIAWLIDWLIDWLIGCCMIVLCGSFAEILILWVIIVAITVTTAYTLTQLQLQKANTYEGIHS